MTYATVCSGIEAPSVAWHPLGFNPVFFSEIEKFPSKVLAHHYPDVPNLGDMTKIDGTKYAGTIDLICGGTPCQSFSVAGLRKGMADPRGNLALVFLRLVDQIRPKWVVWENVPGVLSANNGNDFLAFMNGLEELGYLCDVDILDAQFFGIPQRRRRVFVCAQNVDYLLSQKTRISSITILKLMCEILHSILIELLLLSESVPVKSGQASHSKDGATRRMKLLGILSGNCNFLKLQKDLIEAYQKFHPEVKNWALKHGEKKEVECTLEDLLMDSGNMGQFTLTEELLKKSLEDAYEAMRLFTTLTLTSKITHHQIYTFSIAALNIGRLICRLSGSSPNSLSAVLSFLTLNQEITNYARQANKDIFKHLDGIKCWSDIFRQTEYSKFVVGCLGDWRPAAAVLFERESLRWDFTPRKEERERTASFTKSSFGAYSEGCGTLRANGGDIGGGSESLIVDFRNGTINNKSKTLTANGHVPSANNTPYVMATGQANAEILTGQSPALTCNHEAPILAFHGSQNTGVPGPITHSVGRNRGLECCIAKSNVVRRITPIEAERLQGFPDNYTNIPGAKDGPRYKALGNSMAVPVMRWIGERIKLVDEILKNETTI